MSLKSSHLSPDIISPSTYFSRKRKTLEPWVNKRINLLIRRLITSKMHVYHLSIQRSFWWITCITGLLPIWFVFLTVLITKLHCWCMGFLHARLMALLNKSGQQTEWQNNYRLLDDCKAGVTRRTGCCSEIVAPGALSSPDHRPEGHRWWLWNRHTAACEWLPSS